MIKTIRGVQCLTADDGYTKTSLNTFIEEPFSWLCTSCRLLGWGFTCDEDAITAGILHARTNHPIMFAVLCEPDSPAHAEQNHPHATGLQHESLFND